MGIHIPQPFISVFAKQIRIKLKEAQATNVFACLVIMVLSSFYLLMRNPFIFRIIAFVDCPGQHED